MERKLSRRQVSRLFKYVFEPKCFGKVHKAIKCFEKNCWFKEDCFFKIMKEIYENHDIKGVSDAQIRAMLQAGVCHRPKKVLA